MSKILVISFDAVDIKMAGCGIRSYEIAKFLSNVHNVTLAAPNRSNIENCRFKFIISSQDTLKKALKENEVIIFQGATLSKFPFLKEAPIPKIIDMYVPFILEDLETHAENEAGIYQHHAVRNIYFEQLLAGDYFLCANERQKDFLLGMLCLSGRLNPVNYRQDKTFQKLIDVIPFGIPCDEPKHDKDVLKGVYKSIGRNDKVILWLGGIWDWFDPITLIKALNIICQKRGDFKLIFLGTKHPKHPVIHPEMKKYQEAVELSKRLSLYNRYIFFEEWIPYNERANYLLESDIGISIHMNNIETRFSMRTRMADYIWGNLPIIATKGGAPSQFIEDNKLGITVDYGDSGSLADAIINLSEDEKLCAYCRQNLKSVSRQFRWDEVLRPLDEFCREPKIAPDKKFLNQWQFEVKLKHPKEKKLKYYYHKLRDIRKSQGIIYIIRLCLRKFMAMALR